MNALRLTFDRPPREIRIPDEFLTTPMEVIIMSLSDTSEPGTNKTESSGLGAFAGRWHGCPLVREPQGNYENRNQLV